MPYEYVIVERALTSSEEVSGATYEIPLASTELEWRARVTELVRSRARDAELHDFAPGFGRFSSAGVGLSVRRIEATRALAAEQDRLFAA